MSQVAYLVFNYAARYWFIALAVFIVVCAAATAVQDARTARNIRRRIDAVAAFAELIVARDPSGALVVGTTYPFAHEALLGSGVKCDIRVRHKALARCHARLTAQDDCVRIRPAPRKEVFVDGIKATGEALAFDGGEISIDSLVFRVRIEKGVKDPSILSG